MNFPTAVAMTMTILVTLRVGCIWGFISEVYPIHDNQRCCHSNSLFPVFKDYIIYKATSYSYVTLFCVSSAHNFMHKRIYCTARFTSETCHTSICVLTVWRHMQCAFHPPNSSKVVSASFAWASLEVLLSHFGLPPNMVTCVRPGPKLKAVTVCRKRGCAPSGCGSWGEGRLINYATAHKNVRTYRSWDELESSAYIDWYW